MAGIANLDSKISEESTSSYPAEDVIEQVFTSRISREFFINCLNDLAKKGAIIKVGGRRLRELIGFEISDWSEDVSSDATYIKKYREYGYEELWPILEILQRFPRERMSKPDLDLFIGNADPEDIANIFKSKGFEVSINEASGGIWVLSIKGEDGIATFVDIDLSWQTGDLWPKLGVLAEFHTDDCVFNLNVNTSLLYRYPLDIPIINRENPLEPRRFAAIARALLWLATVRNPYNERINEPSLSCQDLFFETVSQFSYLIEKIQKNPNLEVMYRSGMRDMALALRVISLNSLDQLINDMGYPLETAVFFIKIMRCWKKSRIYFEHYEAEET